MIACIANPASAGGRTAAKIPEIVEGLRSRTGTEIRVLTTQRRGHAEEIARALRRDPTVTTIIAVGGDGTYQEIANGLAPNGRRSYHVPVLGLVSSGTGQGLAQGIGLPRNLNGQLDVIARRATRRMDIGCITYSGPSETHVRRYFVNECQCGIGGAVVHDVETHPKRLNGRLVFGLGALQKTLTHPNQCVHVRDNQGMDIHESVLGIVVGNGAFTGGGMNLTPGASLFDGVLSLLVMRAQSIPQRWRNLGRIYSAQHVKYPEFSLSSFTSLSLETTDSVPLEADGEFLGTLPCSITIEPAALEIIVPGDHHEPR